MKINNYPTPQYLIYTRKSTDDSDNQKNSIDYQVGECLRYSNNNSLEIIKLDIEGFSQDGIIKEKHTAYKTSGLVIQNNGKVYYEIERPKFKKLVEILAKKKYAGVICLCWDRVSRNDQDGMIIKDLIKNGIDVRFVQATYEQTSSGELHMDIDGMFASHYSRVISEKVKLAYAKLHSEGRCTYKAPYGYLDNGSDNKPLDPERAPSVGQIFEMYATGGWSLSQLAKWANKEGLTTKPVRKKRTAKEVLDGLENYHPQAGHKMTDKSIELILKNPFYIGKLKIGEDIIEGVHKPLINVSLYNKVQDVLKSKNVNIYYVDKDFYAYRGFIKCNCGRSYSPYTKKGINYYRCRCKNTCTSTDVNLNESEINDQIEELLGQIYFSDEELQEIESRAKFDLKKVSQEQTTGLESCQKRQSRIFEDINYLEQNKITLLRSGTYTPDQILVELRRLNTELEEVEVEMKAYKESATEMLKYVLTFSELVKNARLYYEMALDTEKREITTEVFSELVFYNGKLANYKLKKGFDTLFKRHTVSSSSEGRTMLELRLKVK